MTDDSPSERNNQLGNDNDSDNADNGNDSKYISAAAADGNSRRYDNGDDASNNDGYKRWKKCEQVQEERGTWGMQ